MYNINGLIVMGKQQLSELESAYLQQSILDVVQDLPNQMKESNQRNIHIRCILGLINKLDKLFEFEYWTSFEISIKKLKELVYYRIPNIGEVTQCPRCKKDHLEIIKVTDNIFFMEDNTHANIQKTYNVETDRFQTYDGCED